MPWQAKVLLAVTVLGAAALLVRADDTMSIGEAIVDGGIRHYAATSPYQGDQPTEIRILVPAGGITVKMRFLYVLPVEPGPASGYTRGDGLAVIKALNLHDKYNLIVVAPTFAAGQQPPPWYADNPSDKTIHQESYFVRHIVPAVDKLYPRAYGRLLLGYGRSGFGALSLLLRHQDIFAAAAAWDAPLAYDSLKTALDAGEQQVFSTQSNLDQYAIPKRLPADGGRYRNLNRIWLGDNKTYHDGMAAIEQSMSLKNIMHTWDQNVSGDPKWDQTWVLPAVKFLGERPITPPPTPKPQPPKPPVKPPTPKPPVKTN